jgi:CHAT domain-containing protein
MCALRPSLALLAFVALQGAFLAPCEAAAAQSSPSFADGARAYESGDFERASILWRALASSTQPAADRARAYLGIAAADRRLGLYQEGLTALRDAEPHVRAASDPVIGALAQQQLGNLLLASHEHVKALDALRLASNAAANAGPAIRASILNDFGNALALNGFTTDAIDTHRHSIALAQESAQSQLELNASLNLLRLEQKADRLDEARATFATARTLATRLAPSFERTLALLELSGFGTDTDTDTETGALLDEALRYANESGNERLLAQIYLRQGALALARARLDEAERLTEQALLHGARAQARDLTYRAHWQTARIRRERGQPAEAALALERALAELTPIRQELTNGYRDSDTYFEQQVKPLYLDLVDTLFASAATATGVAQQATLARARDTIELLKSAELQDYFRDECVVEQERAAAPLEAIAAGAAILYPVVLADRVELLLQIDGALSRHTVAVAQSTLNDNARQLRELIQDPASERFLPYANRLYRWLIAPLRPELEQARVTTLVVVPDGVLRTIPFAVLHDGTDYLVRAYAIAITPSLTLTAPRRLPTTKTSALLTGIAQPVQGFAGLPEVSNELATIRSHIGGRVLIDREYTAAKLSAALAKHEYAILHMATHSVVGDSPSESFLLTYDGRLTLGELGRLLRANRFRDQPVELLTLSACETAIGDERAALGLAGMALRSGARSAVATLWLVADEPTATLMNAFYRELSLRAASGISKARALQAAQIALLDAPATTHPANWAAFMLIGNWL